MNTDFIKGVIVPILTPIDQNELIDEAKFRKQVDYVIDGGVLGILVFGSNGEFYMVEENELERGLNIVIDQAAGRVPIYFGIGAISTKKGCRLAGMAKAAKASGISILQPMFLKPTEQELYYHFATIASAVPEMPVLIYNNPGRTGYTLSAELVERLAREVPNIVGMKDTSGDMTQTAEFIRRTVNIDFKVFGGKDTLLYASMCHGAVGGVCTAANFMPELITEVYYKYVAGDLKGALEAQFKLNPVRLAMDPASFPVAAKDMANLRGRNMGEPYKPSMLTPKGKILDQIESSMKNAGLI
jgi:4-hydroxy-tetrahydrodipicolinate synthase